MVKYILLNQILSAIVAMINANTEVLVIGIYSLCQQESNKTSLNREAKIYHSLMQLRINSPCTGQQTSCKYEMWRITVYEYFDVCENSDKLTSIALDVILNRRFYSSNTTTPYKIEDSRVYAIVSYLDFHLQYLLMNLLTVEDFEFFPIVSFNPHLKFEGLEINPSRFVFNQHDVKSENKVLLHSLKLMGWKKFGFFHLKKAHHDESIFFELYQELFRSLLKETNDFSFFNEEVDTTTNDIARVVKNLGEEKDEVKHIILFGQPEDQVNFVRNVLRSHNTIKIFWVLHEVSFDIFYNEVWMKIISFRNAQRTLLANYNEEYQAIKKQYLVTQFWNYTEWDNFASQSAFAQIELLKKLLDLIIGNDKIMFKRGKITHAMAIIYSLGMESYVRTRDRFEHNSFHYATNKDVYLSALRDDVAFNQTLCPPGYFVNKKQIINKQNKWNFSFGWTCQQCPINTIKPSYGNSSCQICPSFFLADHTRTFCYDSYKPFYLNPSMTFVQVSLAISSVGSLLVFFIVVLFIKYRRTPIVKVSDIKLTMMHLASSLVLFVIIGYTSLNQIPTIALCYLQCCTITVCYSTSLSIVLMRSYKILIAFQSKVRSSKKKQLLTVIIQMFVIFVIVDIAIAIFFITTLVEKPQVLEKNNPKDLTRITYCGTSWHLDIQIGYSMLLQCTCLIIAFRGRNLPDVYSEAITLVYISFISTMVFSVMFPIQYFRKNPVDKFVVKWFTITMNNLLYLVFCYGKKVYFLLFKKAKNNLDYFRAKTFAAMQDDVKRFSH